MKKQIITLQIKVILTCTVDNDVITYRYKMYHARHILGISATQLIFINKLCLYLTFRLQAQDFYEKESE